MKSFRSLLFAGYLLIFFLPIASYSQRCATVEFNKNLQIKSIVRESEQQFEQWMQNNVESRKRRVFSNGLTQSQSYTIPVVVHIIHNGEAIGTGANISTAQIKSQIDVLNKDFNRQNTDASNTPSVFQPFAAGIDIKFVLAKQDPSGNPTNGITRTKGTKTNWNPLSDSDDTALKALSYWAAENYLNIWVTDLSGGNLGYTQLPVSSMVSGLEDSSNQRLTDGVVIDYKVFGSSFSTLSANYNLGRTGTHEVGHFFGLRHIWGDGNCATDYVDDTPFQQETDNVCPPHPQPSCDVASKPYKMFQNYMDYSLDACMNLFTHNQADRMSIIIENSPRRASLLISPGATAPPNSITDIAITGVVSPGLVHCIPNPVIKFNVKNLSSLPLENFQVQSSVNGAAVMTQNFTNLSIDVGDEMEFQLSAITLSPGQNKIIITAVNPNDNVDEVPSNSTITYTTYLDQSTDVAPLRLTLDNTSEVQWLIATPTDYFPWEYTTTTKDRSLVYKAFTHTAINAESWFVSPTLDFSTITKSSLFFDASYAQRLPGIDHLKILYSTDCGVTYANTLLDLSGSNLGSGSSSTEWVPTTDQAWRRQYVNIDELAGKKNIRLAFVAVNGNGNDIFLDNIEIFASDSNVPIVPQNQYQLYYPNGNETDLALSFNLPERNDVRMQVYNIMGQIIIDNILPNTINQTYYFDLSSQSTGLYIFRVQIDDQVTTTKVFIGH